MKSNKNFKGNVYKLLNQYHQWRYWGYIARMMKKNGEDYKEEKVNLNKKPGIALSFDDSFRVEHWYKYGRSILGYYDTKVTFNINGFHQFEKQRQHTQSEIDMLLGLQADGHEIAHHGFRHKRATHYAKEYGVDYWIENEIKDLIDWMDKQSHSVTKEKFKRPVSYAFPHFSHDKEHIKEIVPKFFKIVRGHHYNDNLIHFNHTGFAPSICIDENYLSAKEHIRKVLKFAKKKNKNIILTCHSILPDELKWSDFGWGKIAKTAGNWRIAPETLQWIIIEAKKLDMPFYTTAELAGVATFIDSNLERCIRKLLPNPNIQWIPIADLKLIKKLDISNNHITNLDGIEYLTNLEHLNIYNNPIKDFRLLKKLPHLKRCDYISIQEREIN